MSNEFQQSVAAVISVLKDGVEIPEPNISCFTLNTDSWNVGARIRSIPKVFQPTLSCNIGTQLSIDDLILTSCCDNIFFSASTETGNHPAFEYHAFQHALGTRYLDYSSTLERSVQDRFECITTRIPHSEHRLNQASLLSSLALQWILLHEISHWLLGHCEIAHQREIDEVNHHLFQITTEQNATSLSTDEKKCVELQADGLAFELMFHSLFCNVYPNQCWTDYFQNQTQSNYTLDLHEAENRLRALLLASGAMVLVFEKARSQHRSHSSEYPRPLTRLHNLFATALRLIGTYSNTLTEKPDGTLVMSHDKVQENHTQFTQLASGLTSAMHDLAILTKHLQIETSVTEDKSPLLSRSGEVIHQGEVFYPNISSLMSGPKMSEGLYGENKIAAQQYLDLLKVQKSLNSKLEDFSLIEL